MKQQRVVLFLGALALVLSAAAASTAGSDPGRYLEHVKFLSSEKLAGRGTGTPGLEKAAAYVARQFKELGVQPAGVNGYYQPFPVTTNAKLGPKNRLEAKENGDRREFKFKEDFQPFNFSASKGASGQVVFVGYGITAREYHYDDYAGVDVKDKIAVVLRHEPQEFDEKSVFSGKLYTQHAQLESKAANAKMHGAAAVVFVNDLPAHSGDSDSLDKFPRTVGPANAGIPFIQVKGEVAERWLALSGKNLKDLVAAIDKDLKPQSFALPASLTLDLQADVEREVKTVNNVVAYLPGKTDEYLVLGAHYDHLGLGEQFSMAPSLAGTPHLGADDNASGTAGLLELARVLSAAKDRERGVLFIAFAAEELGLLGSGYYVNNPQRPIDKAVAMINLDMIGRLRDNKVFVGGTGTAAAFKALLESVKTRHPLTLDTTEQGGYGSSDHTSFTTKQIPVLFFFSGLHGDYHRPSDTWDKINAPGAAQLVNLVSDLSLEIVNAPERPKYVQVADPRAAAGSMGGGAGYGAYFGSVPDFAEVPNGFRFADVRPGSPAAKAGLKPQDILFEFDGKSIANLYDFTYALRSTKPGDTVLVKVRRGGEVVEAKVTLESRK
ncbi:MAG: M28 family peptidase [Bryobacteraceae bacterium]|nr:M28 family peptidase [Bryobacteraceae bacterium]